MERNSQQVAQTDSSGGGTASASVSSSSEVAQAKALLAQQHREEEHDRPSQTDEIEYDEPRCSWSPGGEDDQCGEGLICPPCS